MNPTRDIAQKHVSSLLEAANAQVVHGSDLKLKTIPSMSSSLNLVFIFILYFLFLFLLTIIILRL